MTMTATTMTTKSPMAESSKGLGISCVLGGAAMIVLSIACSGGGSGSSAGSGNAPAVPGGVVPREGADAEATSPTVASTQPATEERIEGRSFTDTSPVEERPDLIIKPNDARLKGGGRGVGISGLAGSVDPSRLTPEALAENPLEIGIVKRPPFVLAPGADPLDAASYDWEKDKDGYWIISYSDLSLTDVDKEMLLDALVYPDEYEDSGEEIQFPDRIRALHGEKVALTGYMIAMRWDKNHLMHFMLVRDLKSCCFGQQPEADEWVDVPMKGDGTSYIQFVPVVTRGVFSLAGSSDDAGYAVGAYKIVGDDTREE